MQIVHFRVAGGILDYRLHKSLPRSGVGITQVRVGGYALPEIPPAVHQRQQRPLRFSGAFHFCADMLIADGLAGPAMAHPVVQQPAQRNGVVDTAVHRLILRIGNRFGRQQRIVFVGVPVFQEGFRLQMLYKKAVAADFGQPVDEVQHIFHAVGSFDADAAMAEGGCLGKMHPDRRQADHGHDLVRPPRHQEPAAQFLQEPIDAQQDRAVVAAADLDAGGRCVDGIPVVQIGIGNGVLRRTRRLDRKRQLDSGIPGGGHSIKVCLQFLAGVLKRPAFAGV